MTPEILIPIAAVVVVVVLLLLSSSDLSWRVAEPDEALIISGLRASGRPDGTGESMGFGIVTGRGT